MTASIYFLLVYSCK